MPNREADIAEVVYTPSTEFRSAINVEPTCWTVEVRVGAFLRITAFEECGYGIISIGPCISRLFEPLLYLRTDLTRVTKERQ
jgi:hypothetical protein